MHRSIALWTCLKDVTLWLCGPFSSLSMSATCCYTVFVPIIQLIIAHVLQKYNHQYWHNSIIISSLLCQATHFTQRESVRFQQLHCRWKKRNNHKSTRMVWSNSVLQTTKRNWNQWLECNEPDTVCSLLDQHDELKKTDGKKQTNQSKYKSTCKALQRKWQRATKHIVKFEKLTFRFGRTTIRKVQSNSSNDNWCSLQRQSLAYVYSNLMLLAQLYAYLSYLYQFFSYTLPFFPIFLDFLRKNVFVDFHPS